MAVRALEPEEIVPVGTVREHTTGVSQVITLIAVIVLPIPSDCGPERARSGNQAYGNSQSR